MRWLWSVVVLLFAFGCSNKAEEEEKKRQEQARAAYEETAPMYAGFAKMLQAWPRIEGDQVCPDEQILRETPQEAKRELSLVDWKFLRWVVEPTQENYRPSIRSSFTDQTMKELTPQEHVQTDFKWRRALAAWKELQARPYVAMWREDQVRQARAETTSRLAEGQTSGHLVIFDTRTSAPLCWTSIVAGSSERVAYQYQRGLSEEMKKRQAQAAVEGDVDRNLRADMLAKVPQITKALRLLPPHARPRRR